LAANKEDGMVAPIFLGTSRPKAAAAAAAEDSIFQTTKNSHTHFTLFFPPFSFFQDVSKLETMEERSDSFYGEDDGANRGGTLCLAAKL
jgi:hypothetical protein